MFYSQIGPNKQVIKGQYVQINPLNRWWLMYEGLNVWKERIREATIHFRHLWHWSDYETDKLKFYRLNEILMEAKKTYPDHFNAKDNNG